MVRPAGRTHLEVEVLYTLGKEKCSPNGKGGVEAITGSMQKQTPG